MKALEWRKVTTSCLAAGVDGYIAKPVALTDLANCLGPLANASSERSLS